VSSTNATESNHSGPSRRWTAAKFALPLLVLIALGVLPQIASLVDDPFLVRVGIRIMILAIAASSLNFILGYGGMVSLGHAAFIGVAAYAVGILNWHLGNGEPLLSWPLVIEGSANIWIVAPVAIIASALAALIIGFVSLRTSGLHFIMITLAFDQMLYYFFVSLQKYGGDDGTQLIEPLRAGTTELTNRIFIYYIVFTTLLGVLFLIDRIVESNFGLVLQGCRQNERRLTAVGYRTYNYKLVAFVIAGSIAGVSGVLLATAQQFVSPSDLAWSRSGELVIMLAIGGVGTLFGPVLGALAYVLFEVVLESWTIHWQVIFGPILVLFVLGTKGGILGSLESFGWGLKGHD
jgi:branched-chain amino acid transport system permease protein